MDETQELVSDEEKKEYVLQNWDAVDSDMIAKIVISIKDDTIKEEVLKELSSRIDFFEDWGRFNFRTILHSFKDPDVRFRMCEKHSISSTWPRDFFDTLEEDSLKLKFLEKCIERLEPMDAGSIILNIEDESIKLEALRMVQRRGDRNLNKAVFNMHIFYDFHEHSLEEIVREFHEEIKPSSWDGILSNLEGDEAKKRILEDFFHSIPSDVFVTHALKIQDEAIKEELYRKFEVEIVELEVLFTFVCGLKNDEIKQEAYQKYYKDDIAFRAELIASMESDALKLKLMEEALQSSRKAEKIDMMDVSTIISSLQDDTLRLTYLEKYQYPLGISGVVAILESFHDKKKMLEILPQYEERLIHSSTIMEIVTTSKDDDAIMAYLKKYDWQVNGRTIAIAIYEMQEDEKKMAMAKFYRERIDNSDFAQIIMSLQDDHNKAKVINDIKDRIKTSRMIEDILPSMKEDSAKMQVYEAIESSFYWGNLVYAFSDQLATDEAIIQFAQRFRKKVERRNILGSIQPNSKNYYLLNPQMEEIIKKARNVMGKNNVEELLGGLIKVALEDAQNKLSVSYYRQLHESLDSESDKLLFMDFLEEALQKQNQKMESWIKKGFIPPLPIFKKIPEEKITLFEKEIWLKLVTSYLAKGNQDAIEPKMGLMELSYCFGLFEKNIIEADGKARKLEEGKKKPNEHDAYNRWEIVQSLIDSRKTKSRYDSSNV